MHSLQVPAFASARPVAAPAPVLGPSALERESPAAGERASPAAGEWVHGLTEAEAEDLLDWLEAHERRGATVAAEAGGFAVRCPGLPDRKTRPDPVGRFRCARP
jgi:hypothetical protein